MARMTFQMREHPGWTAVRGHWVRAVSDAGRPPFALPPDGTDADTFPLPSPLPSTVPSALGQALQSIAPVRRHRNPSLWDAIATAIIRQVIRADQARIQHRRLREAHGPRVDTPYGPVHALPTPQTVLDLTGEDFAAIGMAFKTGALRAAAEAYLEYGAKWAELSPADLVGELQSVPRIGPWTAGAAVADYTHDWSLYCYSDLAVRKWAQAAAPGHAWPADEKSFAALWRDIAGAHLGTLTVYTLAWGVQHGGSP